ncbi:hypothetical protein D9757_013365 [Collybiopsis confluens]|uniref:Endonuclease/exonuclease/phosphatase domain-containing protein n=1 Tax=Collybiopsis confluens TaxID=2823264 RepID=A0A8H5GDE9_9AGAR|nr:hypothetical protein D9757_013365 [Collybiopsis confluens]
MTPSTYHLVPHLDLFVVGTSVCYLRLSFCSAALLRCLALLICHILAPHPRSVPLDLFVTVTPMLKTQKFVDWLTESGFSLINEKGIPTYFEHSSRGASSTIDLTFMNPEACALDTAKEWSVDAAESCGSDHHALRWVIDHQAEEIENISGVKYNFKKTDPLTRSAWDHNYHNPKPKLNPKTCLGARAQLLRRSTTV